MSKRKFDRISSFLALRFTLSFYLLIFPNPITIAQPKGEVNTCDINNHPYVVFITLKDLFSCTGVLISNDVVVTAPECCNQKKATDYKVYLGTHNHELLHNGICVATMFIVEDALCIIRLDTSVIQTSTVSYANFAKPNWKRQLPDVCENGTQITFYRSRMVCGISKLIREPYQCDFERLFCATTTYGDLDAVYMCGDCLFGIKVSNYNDTKHISLFTNIGYYDHLLYKEERYENSSLTIIFNCTIYSLTLFFIKFLL